MSIKSVLPCVLNSLLKYEVGIEERLKVVQMKSGPVLRGSICLYPIKSHSIVPEKYETSCNQDNIGYVYLNMNMSTRIMEIENASIPMSKFKQKLKDVNFPDLLRVVLLYVIIRHEPKKVILSAEPRGRNNNEFCLFCMYQKMGFVPVGRIEYEDDEDSDEDNDDYKPISLSMEVQTDRLYHQLTSVLKFLGCV